MTERKQENRDRSRKATQATVHVIGLFDLFPSRQTASDFGWAVIETQISTLQIARSKNENNKKKEDSFFKQQE